MYRPRVAIGTALGVLLVATSAAFAAAITARVMEPKPPKVDACYAISAPTEACIQQMTDANNADITGRVTPPAQIPASIPATVRWYCEDGTPISAYPWGPGYPRDDDPSDADNYVPLRLKASIICSNHGGEMPGPDSETRDR